jgi:hypothetical protein
MRSLVWPLLFPAVSSATGLYAGVRHFTFLYEAPTSAPGSVELENTVTWAHNSGAELREEVEIGVSNRFQIGIYPLDWSYHQDHDDDGFSYDGGAVELIYNLSNPVIDPIGISLYQEISGGRQHFESESKLIAQKNLGPLILDYNLTLEAEWEEQGLREQQGELQQAFGASYEFAPRLSVGIELLHEFVFPDWRDGDKIRNVFIGPNISYRQRNWFVTVTALAQATDTSGEPDFQLRTIFGVGF